MLNGITIEHYIIRSRIDKAKKILRETDKGLGEVARELHYRSSAHFSTQFKKVTGITPSEYKRKVNSDTAADFD